MKKLRIEIEKLEVTAFETSSESLGVIGYEITDGDPNESVCRCPIGWSLNNSCVGSTCQCSVDGSTC